MCSIVQWEAWFIGEWREIEVVTRVNRLRERFRWIDIEEFVRKCVSLSVWVMMDIEWGMRAHVCCSLSICLILVQFFSINFLYDVCRWWLGSVVMRIRCFEYVQILIPCMWICDAGCLLWCMQLMVLLDDDDACVKISCFFCLNFISLVI